METRIQKAETGTSHPSKEQIRAFATGSLSNEDLSCVADHLAQCDACSTWMDSLPDDDTLLQLLRSVPVESRHTLRLVAGFDIVRELARGGMGVVYLARQTALGRDVALKMIHRGAHAHPEELSRFRREAQVIATLRHPNIAQVFDVGEQDGIPYIAMEVVHGPTLAEYLVDGPMDPQTATQFLIQLADAIGHAHARGIIHRDLKPSNILLEVEPLQSTAVPGEPSRSIQPKIVDFGLAKRTAAMEGETVTGHLMGTPKYMSPEQAAGANRSITERTDIYSLGVILYETLVGRSPFEGSTALEVLDQVRNSDPVRPRALRPSIPRDLETICLKCIEKNPSDRYASADELLEDLRRFRSSRAILAKPTPFAVRLWKLAKRHPIQASLGFCALLAIGGLFAASLLFNQRLSRSLKEQRIASRQAEENYQTALEAVDKALERIGFDQLANQPGMERVREGLLADAVRLYEKLAANQPQAESSLASEQDFAPLEQHADALSKLGAIQTLLGQTDQARENLSRAIDIQRRLVRDFPDQLALIHGLAISHVNLGRVTKEPKEFQLALDLLRPIRDTYPACRQCLVQALNQLSLFQKEDEREAMLQEVRELTKSALSDSPEDPSLRLTLGQAMHNLGLLYMNTHRIEKAEESITEALSAFRALVADHDGVYEYQSSLAECLAAIANLEYRRDDFAGGLQHMNECYAIRDLLVARYPAVLEHRESLARSYQTHAASLTSMQKSAEALEMARRGLKTAERLQAEYPRKQHAYLVAAGQSLMGSTLLANGQADDAAKNFEQACKTFEELTAQFPEEIDYRIQAGVASLNYSNILRSGSPENAARYTDRAVTLLADAYRKSSLRSDYQSYAYNAYGAHAQSFEALARHSEAADSWRQAIELAPKEDIPWLKLRLAFASLRSGAVQPAVEIARETANSNGLDGPSLYDLACLFNLLADQARTETESLRFRDSSFESLNRPATLEFLKHDVHRNQLTVDNDLASLRTDPRFDLLLEQLSH
jgi:serine/threonine protein kinase